MTRKVGEKILIDGGITVTITKVIGDRVRVGVEAPKDVKIMREELTKGGTDAKPDQAGR